MVDSVMSSVSDETQVVLAEMVKLRSEILAHPHVSDEIKAFNTSLEALRQQNKLKLGKENYVSLTL